MRMYGKDWLGDISRLLRGQVIAMLLLLLLGHAGPKLDRQRASGISTLREGRSDGVHV